eukprot:scpid98801/ scgid31956/ Protein TFG; TRK-fused gene protein
MAGTSSTFGGAFAQQQMATFPSPTQPRHQTAQPGNMSKQTSTTSGSNNFASTNGATSGLSFPSMDLSGKLIIKIRIEGDDDVRRIPIHNEDITYDELLLMMQRVFVGKVTSSDDVVVKYRDDDGDFITMADNSDLTIAKQCSRILHLKIYIRGKMFPHISGCSCDVNDVRQQLIKIRDHVNYLLDLVVPDASKHESGPAIEQPAPIDTTGQDPSRPVDQAGLSVAQTLFDPLKQQQQQQQQQQPPQAQQPPQQSPAGSDHSGAVMQAVQAAPVATPVSSAAEPVGTASAIADSFGLSADEMAPPPEQPNAPPSDAMTTGTYPPSQQQQPSSQAPPQQTGQQQQQQQMPPTSSGYPGSSTAAYPASGAAPPSTSASAPPPTGYPAASFSGNAATTSPAASYYNQPGSQGPPQATQPPSNPYGGGYGAQQARYPYQQQQQQQPQQQAQQPAQQASAPPNFPTPYGGATSAPPAAAAPP